MIKGFHPHNLLQLYAKISKICRITPPEQLNFVNKRNKSYSLGWWPIEKGAVAPSARTGKGQCYDTFWPTPIIITSFTPLAKHPIPLGREIRYAQMLPRVYALTMWMLRRVAKSIVGPSNLCYSNISSDPWHEGCWIMVDG